MRSYELFFSGALLLGVSYGCILGMDMTDSKAAINGWYCFTGVMTFMAAWIAGGWGVYVLMQERRQCSPKNTPS